MKLKYAALCFAFATLFVLTGASTAIRAGGAEYNGQFETTLVANTEDLNRVIFKPISGSNVNVSKSFSEDAHLTSNRLPNPTRQPSLVAVLVEEPDEKPVLLVDLNADNQFSDNEKFTFSREEKDNPYLFVLTVNLPVKNSFFTVCPLFLRYFKDVQTAKMTEDDRLFQYSSGVFARGKVDLKDKKVLVQYAYNFQDKTISPNSGWLGVDADENGEIDMDNLSPEAAEARDETIVFRVGQTYLSTKKADVGKNQIVMREHEAKEYKRAELAIGKEFPEFSFVDLDGKKRKFSEFRGKYVLLDFWGLWCTACRDEIPYIREAYNRFRDRNFEVVGMNTDKFTPESIKKTLSETGLTWTQARLQSFVEFAGSQLRIQSFPTTFLIAPDGKILSMSRQERGELDLRGKDLLDTLDEILPAGNAKSH